MAMRLLKDQPAASTNTIDVARTLFYQDVQGRNGVSRTEAEQVLTVLDQLIAVNSPRLVHIQHNPKQDKKTSVVKFGLNPTGPVFWAAHPGPVFGAKLVVLPQANESLEALRASIRAQFHQIDHGSWKKAHPDELQPTIEFRFLRFPRDFDRVIKVMSDALAAI
jgi:hypothetical protein